MVGSKRCGIEYYKCINSKVNNTKIANITLFRSITMVCGTNNTLPKLFLTFSLKAQQGITKPQSEDTTSVVWRRHIAHMDMNNVMEV